MKHSFEQLKQSLDQKGLDLRAYQEYLFHLEQKWDQLTHALRARNVPLREYSLYLSQEILPSTRVKKNLKHPLLTNEERQSLEAIGNEILQQKISLEALNKVLEVLSQTEFSLKALLLHLLHKRLVNVEEFIQLSQGIPHEKRKKFYHLRDRTDQVPEFYLEEAPKQGKFQEYELLEELGEGGMGVVYKAYHRKMNQTFALKVMKTGALSDEMRRKRFYREMQLMAKLQHPGIVRIFNAGNEEEKCYLVMEYVPGKSLDQLSQNLFLRQKVEIIEKVLESLAYVHQHQILHRDLKLANILLTEDGQPKIADFGLAKEVAETKESQKLTQTGMILGTLPYLAPEQARGEEVDEKTDLYAIGVCLYRLLTHRYPFEGSHWKETIDQIVFSEPKPPSLWNAEIHSDLEAIVLKALEKEKSHRYLSASAFSKDLRLFLQGSAVEAKQEWAYKQIQKWSRRNRKRFFSGLILLSFCFALIGLGWGLRHREQSKQWSQKYSTALQNYENGQHAKNSEEKKRFFLQSLSQLNEIGKDYGEHAIESLKGEVSQALLTIAYESQSYFLAHYLVTELCSLRQTLPTEKNRLKTDLEEKKSKDLKESLQRLHFWEARFIQGNATHEEAEEAIYEVLKMPQQEIFEAVCQSVRQGNQEMLNAEKNTLPIEGIKSWVKIVGYSGNPKGIGVLMDGLKNLSEKLSKESQEKRSLIQIDYMVELFRALTQYFRFLKKEHVEELREIRWKMEQQSLFWIRTERPYQQLWQKVTLQEQTSSKEEMLTSVQKFLERGLRYQEARKFSEAIQDYTKAIALNPTTIVAYNNRGRAREELGDFEGALQDYTETIRLDPRLPEAYTNRGVAKYKLEIFQEAIEDFNEAIRLSPYYPKVYTCRGAAKLKLKDFDGAIQDYSEAIRLNPHNSEAYAHRSIAKKEAKNIQGALDDLQEAIRLNPHDAAAYNHRGNIKKDTNDLEEAIQDFTEAIRLDPHFFEAYSNRGIVKKDLGDFQGALQDYAETLRLNPNYEEAYCNRAIVKIELNDLQGALSDFNQTLLLNPQLAEVYSNRSVVKRKLGDCRGALKDCMEALRLDPQFPEAYNNRGLSKIELGDLQGALEDFDQAISLNTHDASSYNYRAVAQQKMGNLQKAIESLSEAIRLNPNFAEAYQNRGIMKTEAKDISGALKDHTEAIRLNPRYADAYNSRGILKNQLGDLSGTLQDFTEVIRLNPQGFLPYTNRGIIKISLKDFAGAIQDFTEAIQLAPQEANPYYGRGWAKREKGDLSGAIMDIEKGFSITPSARASQELIDLLRQSSQIKFSKEDWKGAKADLLKLKEYLPPNDSQQKQIQQAIQQLDQHLQVKNR